MPVNNIKISNVTLSFTILLLFSILPLTSCQPQNPVKSPTENVTENMSQVQLPATPVENITLESGFEIQQGTALQREATYDDIIHTPGAGVAYRGNSHEVGKTSGWDYVKVAQVKLKDGYIVGYRDDIETKAGQIRYNVIGTFLPGGEIPSNYNINLRLTNTPDDIRVMMIEQLTYRGNSIVLTIEIPQQAKPGDYKLGFLIFINGKYYGDLPCIIHVTE